MSTGLPARRAALAALTAVEEHGAWSNLAVPEAIGHLDQAQDRAFASHLAYDTLRWEGTLDWALGQVLSRPLAEVEAPLRRVLRLGAVQLLRSGVPARAAVDTCVSLAREQVPAERATGAGGFVNGVLRALDRRRDGLPWPDAATEPVAHLALTTGHPRWVVSDLHVRFGHRRTAAILAADNDPPGLTLRSVGERDPLVEELRAEGLDATAGCHPQAVRVPGGDPRRLTAVQQGRAVPQDEASMHVVDACQVTAGQRVLDLCAGRGGKTSALAQLVGPEGRVVAVELHPHRADMVRRTVARLGLEVDVLVGDATDPQTVGEARFDAVLVDAPCTGLGTGRRRPEVRWRKRATDPADLAVVQRRLLERAALQLRPGGRLIYAVCTWTAEETDRVADHLDSVAAGRLEPGSRRQLLPDRDGTDGMFITTWQHPADE